MSRELLTYAQQTRIAAMVTDYLPDEPQVRVRRLVRVPDSSAGFTSDFETIADGLPALITPWIGRGGGIEMVQDERFEQTAVWKISVPALTDVLAADRIQDHSGREWEVKSVAAAESLEVIRELICIERLSG